ncbi:Cytochrome P450 [Dillenia turbinata]|uniref:Cytochrome P450 n=1 Tax=Dillenia turbinata TaxID=194707 RepID=A0AAN8UKE3_9MAGN
MDSHQCPQTRPPETCLAPTRPVRASDHWEHVTIRYLATPNHNQPSQTYGPIMSLKLGTMTTIVFSSSDGAEEVFKRHDKNFANKTVIDAVRAHDNDKLSMGWQPADAHWRICHTEIFTVKRLEANQGLRQIKVQDLLDHVLECSQTGRAIHIAQAGFITSLNFLSNTIFSMDLAHYDSEKSHEFMGLVKGLFDAFSKPNLTDFFPILGFLDPQGIRRQSEFYMGNLLAILNDIVNTRLESDGHGDNDDMLNALIKLHQENESKFSRKDLIVVLLEYKGHLYTPFPSVICLLREQKLPQPHWNGQWRNY